jgi:phage/plasmid-like protein (TIGR03299 family)
MAHALHNNTMVYAGATPWHRLGVQLPQNFTPEELKAQGIFYSVIERPIFASGVPNALTTHKALVRADTNTVLSVVSGSYGVVQFDTLAQTVCEALGGKAVLHTAGLLGEDGARGWLLGEVPEPLLVKGDESPIKRYFLATTAHTGVDAVILKPVATRVVCQNTLAMANAEGSAMSWRIRHTSGAVDRVKAAGQAYASMLRSWESFGALCNRLASARFTDADFSTTLDAVMPIPQDGKRHSLIEEGRDTLKALWHGKAKGMYSGIRGTAWGAVQAWTEYVDHYRAAHRISGAERLEWATFGAGETMRTDAMQAIVSSPAVRNA